MAESNKMIIEQKNTLIDTKLKLLKVPIFKIKERKVKIAEFLKFKICKQILDYLRERANIGKLDIIKTVIRGIYGITDFSNKDSYHVEEQTVSDKIMILQNKNYIEEVNICPRCGNYIKELEKYVPKRCKCGFQLVDEWVEYGNNNRSSWAKKIFRISQKALNEIRTLERTQIQRNKYNLKKDLYRLIREIIHHVNNLRKRMQKINKRDFIEAKENVVRPITEILLNLVSYMKEIKKYHQAFFLKHYWIPWHAFINTVDLIKNREWNTISFKVWSLITDDLKELIEGINHIEL